LISQYSQRRFQTARAAPLGNDISYSNSGDVDGNSVATSEVAGNQAPTEPPAVLEITPDVIDALAAEARAAAEQHPGENTAVAEYGGTGEGRVANRKARKDRTKERKKQLREHGGGSDEIMPTSAPARPGNALKQIAEEKSSPWSMKGREDRTENGDDWVIPPREPWMLQKDAIKKKIGDEAWNPRKRLSPDAINGIRAIHAQFPEQYTTEVLARKFEVTPEAIRRILKSKWRPSDEEAEDRKLRWYKRGEKVWSRYAELGVKPPRKWRDAGIGVREKGWKSKPRDEVTTTKNTRSKDSIPWAGPDSFL
jgi:hypothetical protein